MIRNIIGYQFSNVGRCQPGRCKTFHQVRPYLDGIADPFRNLFRQGLAPAQVWNFIALPIRKAAFGIIVLRCWQRNGGELIFQGCLCFGSPNGLPQAYTKNGDRQRCHDHTGRRFDRLPYQLPNVSHILPPIALFWPLYQGKRAFSTVPAQLRHILRKQGKKECHSEPVCTPARNDIMLSIRFLPQSRTSPRHTQRCTPHPVDPAHRSH